MADKIYFPICLSNTKEVEIRISNDVVIKRLDLTFLGRFFQLKFDENNIVSSLSTLKFKEELISYLEKAGFSPTEKLSYLLITSFIATLKEAFNLPIRNIIIEPATLPSFSGVSNYAIEVDEEEKGRLLNLSMKLTKITKTGIYVGIYDTFQNNFAKREIKSCRIYPRTFYGNCFFEFNDNTKKKVIDIYNYLSEHKTNNYKKVPKWKEISELYLEAISSEKISNSHRFLNLIITLETLLSLQGSEISFKFSLFLANLFNEHFKLDFNETYRKLKDLYGKRCSFVHSSEFKICEEDLNYAIEYARQALNLYLKKPELFKNVQNNFINYLSSDRKP